MLIVSNETLSSFAQSLIESKDGNFVQEKLEEIQKNNPVLTKVILDSVNKAQKGNKFDAIQQMLISILSIYELMQSQYEAEQLNKEIKL